MSVYLCVYALYLFKHKKSIFGSHIEKSEEKLCQVVPDLLTFDRGEYILKI